MFLSVENKQRQDRFSERNKGRKHLFLRQKISNSLADEGK